VNVRATTKTRGDIVDVVVHVLVNASLETKRPDDARVVMFLAGRDELFTEFKRFLKQGFSDGGGVVANHGHLGNLLVNRHGHLLRCRKANMPVE